MSSKVPSCVLEGVIGCHHVSSKVPPCVLKGLIGCHPLSSKVFMSRSFAQRSNVSVSPSSALLRPLSLRLRMLSLVTVATVAKSRCHAPASLRRRREEGLDNVVT